MGVLTNSHHSLSFAFMKLIFLKKRLLKVKEGFRMKSRKERDLSGGGGGCKKKANKL